MHTVDSLIALGAIRPVIVVGVPNTRRRRRDITGPTRIASDSAIAPRVGGSAAFRRFLSDELIPAVRARYRTTGERTIVGESLAGLFIVEAFLAEPAMFDHYVASIRACGGTAARSWTRSRRAWLPSTPRRARCTWPARTCRTSLPGRQGSRRCCAPAGPGDSPHQPRPDLTHATIFRAVGPAALARALR